MKILIPLLFVALMLVDSQRPDFRRDYRYEKAFGCFYKLHQSRAPWAEARARCEAEAAELLVPETLDEADAMPLLVTSVLAPIPGVFVGIHDLYSERTFTTTQGELVSGSILDMLWDREEPRHSGGRCVAMRRDGHLFAHPCSEPLPFICKVKDQRIAFQEDCHTFDPHWKLGPNGTCYIAHEEPQTWHGAHATCLGAGGALAVLAGRAEAEHVRALFRGMGARGAPAPLSEFAFLGFSDLMQRHHYRTVFGDPVDKSGYNVWDFKCSEKVGNGTKERRCGGILRSGLLATADCQTPAIFFCKKLANESSVRGLLTDEPPYKTEPYHSEETDHSQETHGSKETNADVLNAPQPQAVRQRNIKKNESSDKRLLKHGSRISHDETHNSRTQMHRNLKIKIKDQNYIDCL